MAYENDLKIYVCRNLEMKVPDLWARNKHYD